MKNKKINKSFYSKKLYGILCAVIAVGSLLIFPQFEMKAKAAEDHTCVYRWVTVSEGSGYADLYQQYSCKYCGYVKEINYMRSEIFVKERLYKQIEGAKKQAIIYSDFGLYHTVHDDLFALLSERNDLTVIIGYQYKGTYYQTTFPAGADYKEFLEDEQLFYGMLGLDGRCGIFTSVGNEVVSDLSELDRLEGAELLYARIRVCPQQGTVYFDLGNVHTVNETLITTLSKRNDVTAVITYKYNDKNYKTTFSAGADYSELLNDSVQFYGMLGLSGRCGIVTEICE